MLTFFAPLRKMSRPTEWGRGEEVLENFRTQRSGETCKMAKKDSYGKYLETEFAELIDALELPDLQKRFLKSRWLEQLLWLEGKATRSSKWSNRLRLMTILGGALIPALVSLNFHDNQFGKYIGWVAFVLSQMVAISVAAEEYFHFGDKYTQYRATAEYLKSEMWQFLQLSGSYQEYPTHAQAYSTFALQVEKSIQEDVENFIKLVQENPLEEQKLSGSLSEAERVSATLTVSPDRGNNAWQSSAEVPLKSPPRDGNTNTGGG